MKGMLSMPVLDAKALEVDSQGLAFLKSVLRQSPRSTQAVSEEVCPRKELPLSMKTRLRLAHRAKVLISHQA